MSQYPKHSTTLKPFLRPTIDDLDAVNIAFENLQLQKDDNVKKSHKLQKELSLRDMTVFGLCLTIGTGVFVLSGTLGKNYSGPAIIITHILSSIIVGISAIGYIEFSSRVSVIGGSYTYALASNGELIGFISGFCSIIADPVSSSVSIIGCISYLKSFLHVIGIKFKSDTYWTGHSLLNNTSFISINLTAPILSAFLCIICLFGIKLSSKFMNIVSIFNLSLILLFIIAGIFYIDTSNYTHPCDNDNFAGQGVCPSDVNNSFFPFGIEGVISGIAVCLWPYVGIEQIPTIAEECKESTKIIPKAMFIVWIVITLIYAALSFILLGMVPFQSLDTDAPLANAFKIHNNHILECIVSWGAFSTMFIIAFANIVSSPRVLYRISVDRFMCKIFQYIHPRFHTPSNCIYFFMFISTFSCAFFDLEQVVEWTSVITLFQYCSILIGVLILRYSPPSISSMQLYGSISSMDNQSYYWNEQKILCLSWLYFVSCALLAFSVKYTIIWAIIILSLICLMEFGIFIYLHCKYPWNDWLPKKENSQDPLILMPLSPHLPCLAILLNCYILTTFPLYLVAEAVCVLIAGVGAYFCYGYKHGIMSYTKYQENDLNFKQQNLLNT